MTAGSLFGGCGGARREVPATARYEGSAWGGRWFVVEADGRVLRRRLWDPTQNLAHFGNHCGKRLVEGSMGHDLLYITLVILSDTLGDLPDDDGHGGCRWLGCRWTISSNAVTCADGDDKIVAFLDDGAVFVNGDPSADHPRLALAAAVRDAVLATIRAQDAVRKAYTDALDRFGVPTGAF